MRNLQAIKDLPEEDQQLLKDPRVREAYEQGETHLAFGAALRRMRLEAGLSQIQLQAATGIDQSDISRQERDQTASLAMLRKVAEATGFEVLIELRNRKDRSERFVIARF